MLEFGRDLFGWLSALSLLLVAASLETGRRLFGRVNALERTMKPAHLIDAQIEKLSAALDRDITRAEERLNGRIDSGFALLREQHAELKADIHSMNTDNAESRVKLYERLDTLRSEFREDIRLSLKVCERGP